MAQVLEEIGWFTSLVTDQEHAIIPYVFILFPKSLLLDVVDFSQMLTLI